MIKFYKEDNKFILGDSILDYASPGMYVGDVHYLNNTDYLAITLIGEKAPR